MKTLRQIQEMHVSKTLDGRELVRLAKFIPEADLPTFGLGLNEGHAGQHQHLEFTREAVIDQLRADVSFGFEKALNQRGISAGLMFEVVRFWNWVLEEGLESYDEEQYAMYGLPLFKATAVKYGFENPIGDDSGSESKYDG